MASLGLNTDNIICTHFLKNYSIDGKIFEEKLVVFIIQTLFIQIFAKRKFDRNHYSMFRGNFSSSSFCG
jgi:hypothetical protein